MLWERKSSTVGLYSQAKNHASVKVAHCSGVSGFGRTAGDEIGFHAGGCYIYLKSDQL
jgi:hypothetical protein